jgi:hypothetical protein
MCPWEAQNHKSGKRLNLDKEREAYQRKRGGKD